MARSATAWLLILALGFASSCGTGDTPAGSPTTSVSPEPASVCPPRAPGCLAWDDFGDPDPPPRETGTGQVWVTEGLFCDGCEPELEVRDGAAFIIPAPEKNFIWLATVDTGVDTGIEVIAEITLSPTPRRANVGVVALYRDRKNHLTCKLEVTEGNPSGLLAIGDQLDGTTTSLLASEAGIGLRNGKTYRLRLSIPPSLTTMPVRCSVTGPGIASAEVSFDLPPERIAGYGAGTSQGLRIKVYDDEDDGGSSWRSFLVRRR
jgi:hypothetical protein